MRPRLARAVAAQPAAALRATKRLLRGDPAELLARIEEEVRLFARAASAEFRTGIRAFLARRSGKGRRCKRPGRVTTYSFEGFTPVVDPRAFVHPLAVLIGDVIVGPHCYVGPGASLRGDFGRIVLGAGSNVQDNCVLHSFPGQDVPRGGRARGPRRGAARLQRGRGALIGIHAVVMDDVVVGEEAFVGASSFVRAGFVVPPRTLVTGVPARVVRDLKAEELAWKATGTREYQELAARCLRIPARSGATRRAEPDRPVRATSKTVPLHTIERN